MERYSNIPSWIDQTIDLRHRWEEIDRVLGVHRRLTAMLDQEKHEAIPWASLERTTIENDLLDALIGLLALSINHREPSRNDLLVPAVQMLALVQETMAGATPPWSRHGDYQ